MKIISSHEMAALEQKAYQRGAAEQNFMEEVGRQVALLVNQFCQDRGLNNQVTLLCSKGNNSGDAYVAGCYLLELGCSVIAYSTDSLHKSSPLCQMNRTRFENSGGKVQPFNEGDRISFLKGVIVDGLFGTGFHGEIQEPYQSLIQQANVSGLPILAIDIPSGLNGNTGEVKGEAIRATQTLFLEFPKKGFFLREGWPYTGELRHISFGLSREIVREVDSKWHLLQSSQMRELIPVIRRNWHKYSRGHVVGLAGSSGMMGAAFLSSLAALRTGAGIVHLLHPFGVEADLSSSYEIVKIGYSLEEPSIPLLLEWLNRADALFVGPGLGRQPTIQKLFREIISQVNSPSVIDADPLHWISQENLKLPPKTILTPHLGESAKLFGVEVPSAVDEEYLKKCLDFAHKREVILVLKGAPTFICHPEGFVEVNPFGDPGMATAGSGDVLTGIIASLLAQGVAFQRAASLGVYLHGISGEIAAVEKTSHCIIASDLIAALPKVFKSIS